MIRALAGLVAGLMLLTWQQGAAHEPSHAYLTLAVDDHLVEGRWDIALRDLELAIGLDGDGDGTITWRELRARHADVAAHALARLKIRADGGACPTRATDHRVEHHDGQAYTVLHFVADCPTFVRSLDLSYRLLFDLDRRHRGLLRIDHAGVTASAVLGPDQAGFRFEPAEPSLWRSAPTYIEEGIWHIWLGLDHVLFVLLLLLPTVIRAPARNRGITRVEVVALLEAVSAFTLAHSITLVLAVLGWIDLPSRLVEPLIAASIVITALNVVRPVVDARLWVLAFGFGLIHGLGFGGALVDLGLPAGQLAVALLAFNLGVEVGQLAIIATFLPIAFGLRALGTPAFAWRLGSLAIAALGAIWVVERTLSTV